MSLGLFSGICVTMSNSHLATFFHNLWYNLYIHIYLVLGRKQALYMWSENSDWLNALCCHSRKLCWTVFAI